MKQEKKRTTLYLIPETDNWLKSEAQRRGMNQNAVIQELVYNAMNEQQSKHLR